MKIIISLFLALLTVNLHAGTMGANDSHKTWSLGGKAIYIKPAISNDAWTTKRTGTDGNGLNQQTFGTPPNYSWGYFLEGSYQQSSNIDFNLNIYYLDNNQKSSGGLAGGGSRFADQNIEWVATNFEIGRKILFEDTNDMRIHGGVQYAHLKRNRVFTRNTTVANSVAGIGATGLRNGVINGVYNGFGPRVGIDLNYRLPNSRLQGFNIYTTGATAILAGTGKNDFSVTTSSANNSGRVYKSANIVVPELEAKLGLNYKSTIVNGALTLDAGWLWNNYFASLLERADEANSNISFQGLYFGAKWVFS